MSNKNMDEIWEDFYQACLEIFAMTGVFMVVLFGIYLLITKYAFGQ